ncbi:MAG: histidine kinase [Bacteroidetes bacterium]|nr:MAG: histidine kinase [Bacteroidota bacterium]
MAGLIEKLRIDKRIRVGYGSAFFVLFISYLLTLYANREFTSQAKEVNHTNSTINYLEGLVSTVKDAETGARGYILSGDPSFLTPYKESRLRADTTFYHILEETNTNPLQHKRLQDAKQLVEDEFYYLGIAISSAEKNNFALTDSVRRAIYQGKIIMDELRDVIHNMQAYEQAILGTRMDALNSKSNALHAIIVVSLVLAFLMMGFALITYLRENIARLKADSQVAQYSQELEKRVLELGNANKELVEIRSIEKFASTGRIARTIAHEVRNPLTNINLAVDQLRGDHIEVAEQNLLFDLITRNIDRINHLITGLLDSTKLTELDQQKASVNALLDEALVLADDRIALKNISVVKKYDKQISEIFVDKEKIKIAFLNIIVNAIEAMDAGSGVLTLVSEDRNKKCVVEISDNGKGLDQDSLSKLFEPYFTSKEKGTGLGLTNTQNIILNHKGKIFVDSSPNKGTTFSIILDFA